MLSNWCPFSTIQPLHYPNSFKNFSGDIDPWSKFPLQLVISLGLVALNFCSQVICLLVIHPFIAFDNLLGGYKFSSLSTED